MECLLAVLELNPLPQKVMTTPDRGGELEVAAEDRVSSAGHQVWEHEICHMERGELEGPAVYFRSHKVMG